LNADDADYYDLKMIFSTLNYLNADDTDFL